MRSKALLLGAHPEPIEGPWVEVSERGSWVCIGLGLGNEEDALVIEAQTKSGLKILPLTKKIGKVTVKEPQRVRAVIRKAFHSPHLVTVYIEEG